MKAINGETVGFCAWVESTTKDRFTGTVESCSGEPQAESIPNKTSPKKRENPTLASDCSIVSPKAFEVFKKARVMAAESTN
jgi:hypothetical protein